MSTPPWEPFPTPKPSQSFKQLFPGWTNTNSFLQAPECRVAIVRRAPDYRALPVDTTPRSPSCSFTTFCVSWKISHIVIARVEYVSTGLREVDVRENADLV